MFAGYNYKFRKTFESKSKDIARGVKFDVFAVGIQLFV